MITTPSFRSIARVAANPCAAALVVAWLCCGCASTTHKPAALAGVCPVVRTSEPIAVDGRLDEKVWQTAPAIPFVIPVTFAQPLSFTDARMAYDAHNLYLAFKCQDEDLFAAFTEHDAIICQGDVVEAFFRTSPDRPEYYEFEYSPRGTSYDSFIERRGAAGSDRRWAAWNCPGMRVAVTLDGTLNNTQDRDRGYTVEVAIPFAELPTLTGASPRPGDRWLFNLARYDYSVHLQNGVELSASSPLTACSFHLFEDWRTLRFE